MRPPELDVITEALSVNSRRKALAERRVAMTLAAFDEGEASLEDVLRSEKSAFFYRSRNKLSGSRKIQTDR